MTVMVLTATDAVEGMSTTIGQVRDIDLTIRRHQMVENGEITSDLEFIGKVIQDISYNNSIKYFGF